MKNGHTNDDAELKEAIKAEKERIAAVKKRQGELEEAEKKIASILAEIEATYGEVGMILQNCTEFLVVKVAD